MNARETGIILLIVVWITVLFGVLTVYESKMEERANETRCFAATQKIICFSEHRRTTEVP